MKIEELVNVYPLLENAKLSSLSDTDKFALIKTMRKFKKVVADYNDLLETGREQLKGDKFNEMVLKAQQWQREGENTTLTEDERIAINAFFAEYDAKINEFMSEERNKEFDDFTKISEDGFSKLISENGWDMKTILALESISAD